MNHYLEFRRKEFEFYSLNIRWKHVNLGIEVIKPSFLTGVEGAWRPGIKIVMQRRFKRVFKTIRGVQNRSARKRMDYPIILGLFTNGPKPF
jgi:hypothetical protein